jgi:hypothetical protein
VKKRLRGINPLRNQVATDVWNAWRRRKAGGFTSIGVRGVGRLPVRGLVRPSGVISFAAMG